MTERELLSGLIKEYCAELDAAGASAYDDYVFSKKYMRRKRQAIKISKGHHGNIIRRSTLFIIAAAILLAGCGIAYALEPIRSFFVESSDNGTKLTPDSDTVEHKSRREQMADEYVIDVPDSYELDKEDYAQGYTHFGRTYRNDSDVIYFDQYRNDVFETYYPPETKFISKTDRDGKEVLVARSEHYTELYWNTGKYTLKLGGSLTEEELWEIYYTARVKN